MIFTKWRVWQGFEPARVNGIAARDALAKAACFDPVEGGINGANFALPHFVQIIQDVQIPDGPAFAIKRLIAGLLKLIFNAFGFPRQISAAFREDFFIVFGIGHKNFLSHSTELHV